MSPAPPAAPVPPGSGLADAFEPPYWAVIFTSLRTDADPVQYGDTAEGMVAMAATIPGYLGHESTRDPATGLGITVSYWRTEAAIAAWRDHADHQAAKRLGRGRWYHAFRLRIARVDRERAWERPSADVDGGLPGGERGAMSD